MKKATSAVIAALAALALSGGAYAQSTGGTAAGGQSSHGSTSSPATNQMNDTNGGYGTPGATNSGSGMSGTMNPSMQQGPNNSSTPAPKTNNTLATPSVKSPADNSN
ncbi:hypothetical protein V4C53_34775 [Paraburkholderia azotifigens]|uniref:hypothetical protein n=1 Tax=Paraburkholderia azotifigens TaxID=2057004 RepID=UPI0004919941